MTDSRPSNTARLRPMNYCPRCREVETDDLNHPTGIRLCQHCTDQLAGQLIHEHAGEPGQPTNLDELRNAYATALRRAYEAAFADDLALLDHASRADD